VEKTPSSSLYSNAGGSTAENYSSFSSEKGTGKEEKRKILKNSQKSSEEETQLICDKPVLNFCFKEDFVIQSLSF